MRPALRLAAGSLAVLVPLAGVAACGTEKKRTVSQELASAQGHLENSKAVSFTLRLADAQGSPAKLIDKNKTSPGLAKALVGASITYTMDAAGDATLKSLQDSSSPEDFKASLEKVNAAFVISNDKTELFQVRVVAGDLYAQVNLTEIDRLSKADGESGLGTSLDDMANSLDPRLGQGVKDLRAGKWIKLPLSKYLNELKELAGAVVPGGVPTPSPDPELGKRVFAAIRPHITVTDANDNSSDRVLDVKVNARPAVKSLLALLKADKNLPFGPFLGGVTPADIDKNLAEGQAQGTLRLKDGHLTKVTVDLDSLRRLSTDPDAPSLAGSELVVDVNDSADAVTAPTNLSSLDLGKLLSEFLGAFGGMSSVGS